MCKVWVDVPGPGDPPLVEPRSVTSLGVVVVRPDQADGAGLLLGDVPGGRRADQARADHGDVEALLLHRIHWLSDCMMTDEATGQSSYTKASVDE